MSTPGRGKALDFTRSYAEGIADPNGPNKTPAADGPFGWGWTHSYNLSAPTAADGGVTIRQEDGSQVAFPASAGTYTTPAGSPPPPGCAARRCRGGCCAAASSCPIPGP
ncbi:DUF6531 domain-containing protein [Amycolatopsis sp. MEPSY49]|uniref:DUF6531 domain-containing protein n=1 Tax=Amycolatopsis sp. MEPSY49 TaxID=3151600 RepID=UPI003F513124